MIDAIKAVTPLGIAIVGGVLLVVFRVEVKKLVGWVVGFRQISKTKDGYSLTGGLEPRPTMPEQPTAVNIAADNTAIMVVSADTPVPEVDPWGWISAMSEKEHDEAIRQLDEALKVTSDRERRIDLMAFKAHVAFDRSITDGCIEFEKLIAEFPTEETPYRWYALSFLWKDFPERALATVKRGIDNVTTNNGRLYDTLSDIHRRLGQDGLAAEAAKTGIECDPEYFENYLNLAAVSDRAKDIGSARMWYLRALSASNGAERVLAAYAKFLGVNGMPAEAMIRYQRLVITYPKNTAYRTLLGNIYLDQGSKDLAMQEYVQADRDAAGKEGWIIANIGNLYNVSGLYSLAIEKLEEALKLDSKSQYSHERLAQAIKNRETQTQKMEEVAEKAREAQLKELPAPAPSAEIKLLQG